MSLSKAKTTKGMSSNPVKPLFAKVLVDVLFITALTLYIALFSMSF